MIENINYNYYTFVVHAYYCNQTPIDSLVSQGSNPLLRGRCSCIDYLTDTFRKATKCYKYLSEGVAVQIGFYGQPSGLDRTIQALIDHMRHMTTLPTGYG